MTGLLFTSERSHYIRKSYMEERGSTSTKSYADRLTEMRLKIPWSINTRLGSWHECNKG